MEKLVDQVAIGGVDLDAVKTGVFRVRGSRPVVVDRALDFVERERSRLRNVYNPLSVTVWLRARTAEGATGATLFGNKLL